MVNKLVGFYTKVYEREREREKIDIRFYHSSQIHICKLPTETDRGNRMFFDYHASRRFSLSVPGGANSIPWQTQSLETFMNSIKGRCYRLNTITQQYALIIGFIEYNDCSCVSGYFPFWRIVLASCHFNIASASVIGWMFIRSKRQLKALCA